MEGPLRKEAALLFCPTDGRRRAAVQRGRARARKGRRRVFGSWAGPAIGRTERPRLCARIWPHFRLSIVILAAASSRPPSSSEPPAGRKVCAGSGNRL